MIIISTRHSFFRLYPSYISLYPTAPRRLLRYIVLFTMPRHATPHGCTAAVLTVEKDETPQDLSVCSLFVAGFIKQSYDWWGIYKKYVQTVKLGPLKRAS